MKKLIVLIAFFLFPVGPAFAQASCTDLQVVSGNNRFVPSDVSFQVRATNASGYRFYFGDGSFVNTTSASVTHTATISGMFTARTDIIDAQGNEISDPDCQTIYSLLTTPLESQKSGCSNVFINGSRTVAAGSNVKFLVTGYDNKSGIQEYKIDFGNGQIKQGVTGNFDITFPNPGTYLVTGSIRDSKNQWLTSVTCQNALSVTGAALTTQPATGSPTWISVAGILAGVIAAIFLFGKWRNA